MTEREEFLGSVANGLVQSEYTERFLQEMNDHLDDAEYAYSMSGQPQHSSQRALEDMGNPKQVKNAFNHVMKYRNKTLVILECLVFAALMVPVSILGVFLIFMISFGALENGNDFMVFPSLGVGGLLQMTLVTVFTFFALRRIHSITFGEVPLIYPTIAFAVGFSAIGLAGIFIHDSVTLSASPKVVFEWSWFDVVRESSVYSGFLLSLVLGVFIAYVLLWAAPWERSKKWQNYRAKHAIPFQLSWMLSVYIVASTISLWFNGSIVQASLSIAGVLQWPRHICEAMILALFFQLTQRTPLLFLAGALTILAVLVSIFMVWEYRVRRITSPILFATVVYTVCLLFFSFPYPIELGKRIAWSVPVDTIVKTASKKEFGIFSHFAVYVRSLIVSKNGIDDVRYNDSEGTFDLSIGQPDYYAQIRAIENVHDYHYMVKKDLHWPIRKKKIFPKNFTCHSKTQDSTQCSTLEYKGKNVFSVKNGASLFVRRIAVDSQERFAVVVIGDQPQWNINFYTYLIQLPQ